MTDHDDKALEVARDLFTDGAERRARRLVLEYEYGAAIAGTGWGLHAVRDRIGSALEEQRERDAAVCEEVAAAASTELAMMAACACADRIRGRAKPRKIPKADGSSSRDAFLYEVILSGATYWVRARTSFEAAAIVFALLDSSPSADGSISVERCPPARAQKLTFRDAGTLALRSMQDEFERGRGPGVIACSEWR